MCRADLGDRRKWLFGILDREHFEFIHTFEKFGNVIGPKSIMWCYWGSIFRFQLEGAWPLDVGILSDVRSDHE